MISPKDYRTLTDLMAEAQEMGRDAMNSLLDVRATLGEMNINPDDQKRNQLDAFLSSNYSLIFFKHLPVQRPMLDAVISLQTHILGQYKKNTIDEFLKDNNLEVSLTFAQMSDIAGFPVSRIGDKKGD